MNESIAAGSGRAAARPRIEWIDIAKGITIVLVILGHTFLYESLARKVIFSFHMPLFFILAGYTFRVKPMKDVASSSFKRLLVPYIIVFWTLQVISLVQHPEVGLGDLARSFGGFVFGSGTTIEAFDFPAAGVIWFLAALFCARITLNFVTARFESRGVGQPVQLVFWVVFAFIGIVIGEFLGIRLPLSYDVAMVACLFMYVGYLAKLHGLENALRRWWVFPIALAVWVLCMKFSYLELAARDYELIVFSIVGAFAGSFLVFQVSYLVERKIRPLCKPLVWLGKNSLLILCIHGFDWMLAPWQSLPFMDHVPAPFVISGCIRSAVDVAIAAVVKRV